MTNPRVVLVLAGAALLAACAQAPVQTVPAVTAPSAPPPVEPPAPPPPPTPPVTPLTQSQAQKAASAAMALLESGHEDPARTELQHALAGDPNNKLALNLMRQITADPVATLGHESFSYTVRANDTMSSIAGRFLGDIYSFYILARYNGIAVPKQLSGGQTLRIPGKAPPASALREPPAKEAPRETKAAEPARAEATTTPFAAPAPPPPPEPSPGERAMAAGAAAEHVNDLERALAEYTKAAGLDQPAAPAKADQVRKQLTQRYSLAARTAFAKQDLDGAIRNWERVLALDPGNDTATLERQRSLALKEKVKKL